MYRHDQLKRAAAALLCASLIITGAVRPAYAEGGMISPSVDEAYYVTLDYYGTPTEAGVVKSYTMNGAKEITDYGTYDEVSNLTDTTEPEIGNGTTTFRFGDNAPEHFYFEGKTKKLYGELPWSITLSYRLNGVPKKAEELAGQSGVVEITLTAVPNRKAAEYAQNNYMLTAAAIFNQDDILSLEAPDAQIQTIGNLRAAAFLWLPGEEQQYTLRIGTGSFEFDGFTFLMGPLNSGRLSEITDLKKNKEELEDSWNDLNDAADEVLDSLDSMKSSLDLAADGLDSLDRVREDVHRNHSALYGELDGFLGNLSGLSECLAPASGHLDAANTTAGDLRANLSELNDVLMRTRGHLAEAKGTLSSLREDMVLIQDVTGDLDSETHSVRSDIDDLQRITRSGKETSSARIGGTLSQMKQLYQAYAAYMKAQGLEPVDAIGDGAVLYDLDGSGTGGVGTPSDAGLPVRYRLSGTADIAGASYPEGSFQDFAIDKLESLGYDSDEIAYAVALWNYRDDVAGVTRDADRAYSSVDGLLEDLLEVDLSQLADVSYATSLDGEQGFRQAADLTEDLTAAIDRIDRIHTTIDGYLPELQETLDNASRLTASLTGTTSSLSRFLSTVRNIADRNSEAANSGAKKTLEGTSDLLRKSADAMDSTDRMRKAKDSIRTLVDDKWDEYTGEKNNLLKLDADAAPESLTSEKNRGVNSVSVMIRTQEIKISETEKHLSSADDNDHRTAGQRLKQMFRDFWSFLTGWMHR